MRITTFLLVSTLCLASLLIVGCGEEPCPPEIAGRVDFWDEPAIKPPTGKMFNPGAEVTQTYGKPLSGKMIIVDAGHGGKDPGALGRWGARLNEKVVVMDIANKLKANLETKGAKVIMTRRSDHFVELDDRAAFADRYHADLLVSIHADAHKDPGISGATVYVARNCKRQSRRVADKLEDAFERAGVATRGVRKADFRVLVRHSRPAVLIESGYLTNVSDANKLNASWYRTKIASVIADGIANAF